MIDQKYVDLLQHMLARQGAESSVSQSDSLMRSMQKQYSNKLWVLLLRCAHQRSKVPVLCKLVSRMISSLAAGLCSESKKSANLYIQLIDNAMVAGLASVSSKF